MKMVEGWENKKLIDLAYFINGYAFKPDDWSKEGLPIIRIEQLKNAASISDYYAGKLPEKNIINNDDLIFSWSASLFLKIWQHGKAALNQHLFKRGIKITWRMEGNRTQFSEADRAQIAAANLQRKKEFELKQQKAAETARYIWKNVRPATTHPYLARKRIQPHVARINKYGALTIPLYNEQLELVNLQFIDVEGNKRFLSGGQKKNCFCWLGNSTETILVAEGFATTASLHEHKGFQTFVAFDAGNLENVAKIIRANRPDAQIIIAGDNDESGVGQKAASAAARAVGGRFVIPKEVGLDWNDVLTQGGRDGQ